MSNQASDNNKRIAKNTSFMFLRMLLVLVVGLYTSRVILRTLGVEDFGIYNVVGSVVVLFTFLQQALTNATSRYITYAIGENDKINTNTTFIMAVNAHFLLAVVVVLLSETVGLYFLYSYLVIPTDRLFAANVVYQFSILAFCFGLIRTPYNSDIIAQEKMGFFAYTSIVEVVLKLLIVYLLVIIYEDKLILYSLFLCCVNFIMLLWYIYFCRKNFVESKYRLYWDRLKLISMMKYSGWSVVVNGADVCVNQSIVYFFNIFLGVVANAALGIATQVNTYLTQFLNSFTQSYNPQIIKSYASREWDYFNKLIFSTSKISYYFLFLMSIPLILNIDYVLGLWLGEVPDQTSTFVIYMLIFSLIDAYSAPLWTAVYANGNIRNHQLIMGSIKILNIPLAYIILHYGLPAYLALFSKALLNFVCSVVRPIYVRHLFKLSLKRYFKEVISPVYLVSVLAIPIPFLLLDLINNGMVKLIITSLVFYFIAFIAIWLVGLNKREKQLVKEIIASKLKS